MGGTFGESAFRLGNGNGSWLVAVARSGGERRALPFGLGQSLIFKVPEKDGLSISFYNLYCNHGAPWHSKSGWPSGLRRQTQVLVFERGRGFKSHF
ncbi:Protein DETOXIFICATION (Multidrug and toxic compound extrusion protein) [Psidium guajava]|nr:Protein DETOXIFICATION (Multidrug and toxic compound extrusion protein) [Psidium guajava]